ncbi:MAG: hypothetical protein Q7S45_04480 [Candidatus Curtissbacteria bacterium]|nr:hypothetical protein [Candidatus Curtissbacteria bacterium]
MYKKISRAFPRISEAFLRISRAFLRISRAFLRISRAFHQIIKFWPIATLLLITLISRIINLEKLFYFTYDESIPAFVGRRLILWYHIPLIGGATPFGFHLGPYFYWFYAALLAVGRLNPLVWGYAATVISVFTTLLMYIVGKNFGGKKVGITAAVFWTFSYLANIYDRHLWALFWGPLTSLLVLFFLEKIISGRQKFIYLLALTIGLSIHADPSNIIFVILAVFAFAYWKVSIKKNLSILFAAIILFTLPLVAFDLRHDFANIRPTAGFIKAGANTPAIRTQKFVTNSLLFPQAATRLVYTFGDNQVAKQYSYCKNFVAEKFAATAQIFVFLSAFAILAFILWSFKNRQSLWFLVSSLLLLYFLGIQIYGTILGGDIFEHYITGLFPAFLLITAFFVSKLPKKLWLVALGIFVAANLYKLSLAQNSQGLTEKREAIEYTMRQVGDKPFSLDSLSTCWKLNGYRYLFAVYGREPVKSYVDPNFAYLYGTTPVWDHHPATVVAFVVHDYAPETQAFYQRYALLKSHQISSSKFGSIEVIVMDNSTGWFDK